MLKLITAPNPILSKPVKEVTKVDSSVLKLIAEMEKTLLSARDPEGVGLAAPQVGKPLAIFIAKPTPKSPILTFINPKILSSEGVTRAEEFSVGKKSHPVKLEGCLSLPNVWGEVKRDKTVELKYQTIDNNHQLITKTRTFSGFMATIVQHETDHLNGVLFPKKVLEQKGKLYKSKKGKKGEDIFEEIEI